MNEDSLRDLYDRVFSSRDPHSPYYYGDEDADEQPEEEETES